MAELRYNPLLDDYVMISKDRSKRPDMPKGYCPFDVGSGRVPYDYDVLKYDNDFPMLMQKPPTPDDVGSDFYKTRESYGKCEVILYSKDHTGKMYNLPDCHLVKLVNLWIDRNRELSKDEKHKYIFIFENKGEEVGTTMPHPHGQIYAYPFVPLRLRIELENSKKFYEKENKNIFDKIIEEEKMFGQRVIMEDDNFIVFMPFFAENPFTTYIVSKKKITSFSEFDDDMKLSFAKTLKKLTASYDLIYDRPFPYMMCMYQKPINIDTYKDSDKYYRFHVKFYPPLRGEKSVKYNASSETGAWVQGNPMKVEDTAKLLKKAVKRYEDNE